MIFNEKNILKNIIEFKNELLKRINSLESRLSDRIKLHDKDFTMKLDTISEKIKPMQTDIYTLMHISSEKEKNIEKIENLEKFKNKTESTILAQNIRINKSLDEISDIKAKYDKIIIENLTIPGFVGHSCKYKNLSEFIISNLKENDKNENQYNNLNNEIVSLKQKTDNLLKMYFGIFDKIFDRANKLIENKNEDLKIALGKKLEEIMDKISEIKLKDIENKMNLENHLKQFKLFTEDVYGFKEHLDKLDAKIEQELNKNNNEREEENNNVKNNVINASKEKIVDIKKSIIKYKKEKEESKKISKILEERGIHEEKMTLKNINDIKDLKAELNKIKNIINSGQKENKMNINNTLNIFKNELNQLKLNIDEINLKQKQINFPIKYNINKDPIKNINKGNKFNKEQQKTFTKNEKEKNEVENNAKDELIINELNNIKKENILKNKEIKKEQELINKTEDFFLTKYLTKKQLLEKKYTKNKDIDSDNEINKNNIPKERKIIQQKEEINIEKKLSYTYIPNIKEDKYTQYKINSSRNNEYSNLFNLSSNDIKANKAKKKREFLSPIVDKMYKEYYIKKNLKEKSNENEKKLAKQTVKKLIPAFGRTNYEPYN